MKVVAKSTATSNVGWLAEGEVSTVLAVSLMPREGAKFLIWSHLQMSAALFSSMDFDVVDNVLSSRWVFSLSSEGLVYLAPAEWHADGFWERFHDGDSAAERIFMKEKDIIFGE